MDLLREKRELNNGFGNALSRAFEIAVTPAIFGAMGYALDRWLGIVPVLTIALLVFGLVGMFVRLWYGYDAEMRAQDDNAIWNRRPAKPVKATAEDVRS